MVFFVSINAQHCTKWPIQSPYNNFDFTLCSERGKSKFYKVCHWRQGSTLKSEKDIHKKMAMLLVSCTKFHNTLNIHRILVRIVFNTIFVQNEFMLDSGVSKHQISLILYTNTYIIYWYHTCHECLVVINS